MAHTSNSSPKPSCDSHLPQETLFQELEWPTEPECCSTLPHSTWFFLPLGIAASVLDLASSSEDNLWRHVGDSVLMKLQKWVNGLWVFFIPSPCPISTPGQMTDASSSERQSRTEHHIAWTSSASHKAPQPQSSLPRGRCSECLALVALPTATAQKMLRQSSSSALREGQVIG